MMVGDSFVALQSFFGFGPTLDIELELSGQDSRKTAEIKSEDGKVETHYLYYDGETIGGKVSFVFHCVDAVQCDYLTKFDGGHKADEAAVDWLTTYGSQHTMMIIIINVIIICPEWIYVAAWKFVVLYCAAYIDVGLDQVKEAWHKSRASGNKN